MKKKITGIFVCVLSLLACFSFVTGSTAESEQTMQSKMQVVTITRPVAGNLYLFDTIVLSIGSTNPIIIGPITFQATAQPNVAFVTWTVTDMNGNVCHPDVIPAQPPNFTFKYTALHFSFGILRCGPRCIINANAQDSVGNPLGSHSINAIKIL